MNPVASSQPGTNAQERATLALARANIYNFLAATYAAPPSAEVVSRLLGGTLGEALADFEAARPHLIDLEHELIGAHSGALIEALAVEHRRLFVGPGAGYVPPYQSVYTDRQTIQFCGMPDSDLPPRSKMVEGLLWGDSTVAAARHYYEAGLEPIGELAGVPDHVAVELQFMQHLCGREAAAWNGGRLSEANFWIQKQHAFLTAHLSSWVSVFADKVTENAQHPWFKAVAALTREFIADELADVAEACADSQVQERG